MTPGRRNVTRRRAGGRLGAQQKRRGPRGRGPSRNRARRRMRALARSYLAPLAQAGTDYVLIARHDTVNADWQDMAKGLQKAIRYLHRSINRSGTGRTVRASDQK